MFLLRFCFQLFAAEIKMKGLVVILLSFQAISAGKKLSQYILVNMICEHNQESLVLLLLFLLLLEN